MSPFYYLFARQQHGYIPLIRSNKVLQGILVVSGRSKLESIKDLQGGKIAFPSPNAFAASLLMRAQLREQENVDFTPVYVETHDNVYRNVVFGNVIAGGGVMRTLNQEAENLKQELTVIYKTIPSASHPLSAHPRVPAGVREAVKNAMLKLQDSDQGRKLLKKIKVQNPVTADHEKDYSQLDDLDLEKYGTLAR